VDVDVDVDPAVSSAPVVPPASSATPLPSGLQSAFENACATQPSFSTVQTLQYGRDGSRSSQV
jgi:hypothetical protein